MEVNDVLKSIFQTHDEMSHASVFDEDPVAREKAFIKAEGLRELISNIHGGIKKQEEQEAFGQAILAHTDALGKGLFYRRNLKFDKGE